MRNRNTIEFLGLWESLHDPVFNCVQFDTFKTEAGLNSLVMTPSKWIEQTGAIGITVKAGRGSGFTPPTGRKWLRTDGAAREKPSVLGLFRVATEEDRRSINENGARDAGGRKARFCPADGQGRAFCSPPFVHQRGGRLDN